ncbi:hypothetical protein GCK32_004918 [Trichostrongylus colubriformis]|uniref:Uncharacterized protein n=1 Tax=Trichostrongylus colubriformis TaxID=6319 RepID=A0AAN8F844_TRICO
MLWSTCSTVGTDRQLPTPSLVTLPISFSIAVVILSQIALCTRRNMKGSTAARFRRVCCLRKGDGYSPRSRRTFESWRNTINDISTCEIINPPSADCGMADAGLEAKIRHRTISWYPELQLQKRSIIRRNYMKIDRSQIPKHPAHAGVGTPLTPSSYVERKAKYKDRHITWDNECPVYVVYGYDPCRGELEYDENTMDDASVKEAEELEKNIDKILDNARTPDRESAQRNASKQSG